MQHPGGTTQADIELHPGRSTFAGDRTAAAVGPATGREAWADTVALALVYVVSIASLAGFATFGLHPALLARSNVSPEVYGRILVFAPRAQILIALGALVVFLVRRIGSRWVPAFLVVYVVSLGAELAGTTAGIPFGPYHYTDVLGAKWLGHVPALIPASWFMMALPSYAIASRRLAHGGAGLRIALGSFILLSWDLALDPAMSLVTKHWVWGTTGPYYGMPLLNLFGWFVTGVALMVVFAALRTDRWVDRLPTGWLLGFYGANLLLPVGMSVAAGLWGVVVATGVALAFAALIARRQPRRGVA
jgi:putative membrane protein